MMAPKVSPQRAPSLVPWDGSARRTPPPVTHRGSLVLDGAALANDISLFSYGPNTPPPPSGDWVVDQPGNNVNNTTVVLNGNLNLTAGDLTLDNVTLIINSTGDGQYCLNVSQGSCFNVTNTNITAFNGSLHYRFQVYGNMTMDRCNVSEMWGDVNYEPERAGVAILSNSVIRNSTVFNGLTSGIQVQGTAVPQVTGCVIKNNGRNGFVIFDNAAGRVSDCAFNANQWDGIVTARYAAPLFVNCTATGNYEVGINTFDVSKPVFDNCTAGMNAHNGIQSIDMSKPEFKNCTAQNNSWNGFITVRLSKAVFTNCTGLGNGWNGFAFAEFSSPVLENCTAAGNGITGIAAFNDSAPQLANCTARDNANNGLHVENAAKPSFTNCTAHNNQFGLIAFDITAPTFTNCTAERNGFGIQVLDSATASFTGCSASNSTQFGITVIDNSKPTFTDCSALGSTDSGISVYNSAAPVFLNCTARGNTNGLQAADTARPSFTKCISSGNSWNGAVAAGSAAPVFSDCILSSNNEDGIAIGYSSMPVFLNCTSFSNKLNGIAMTDTSVPVIKNCSFFSNSRDGLVAYGSSAPVVADCTFVGNSNDGIDLTETSTPVLTNCTSTDNEYSGLGVFDTSRPRLDRLIISANKINNLWVTVTPSLLLPNSTVGGGGSNDILLSNGSRLTLQNTTFTKKAAISGAARLTVQWYLSLTALDRARKPVPGAIFQGAGKNSSLVPPAVADVCGTARNIIVTEYVQNASGSANELTHFDPYDMSVTKDGETNLTCGIQASRSLSAKLYFDYAPRLSAILDDIAAEDRPKSINLAPFISDPDDPFSSLGFATDRDYATIDNASGLLTIICPLPLGTDTITINVTDGLRNGTGTLNISVTPVNDAPACIRPFPDLTVYEDRTLELNLTDHFTDEESGTNLTFTCNWEIVAIDSELRQARWTPGEGNSSIIGVVFTASDGELMADSNPFNITFVPVNEPPAYLGGLGDRTVPEHQNWTVKLDDFFSDEENPSKLVYESSSPEVTINPFKHTALWTPSGGTGYHIEVTFTAHDSENYSMTVSSNPITLTYVPVDDPPVFLGKLATVKLRLGEEWNITLEDHFADEDTPSLRFSVNNPKVKIIELNRTVHYALWKPERGDANLTNVVFTAYDGTTRTNSPPISLKFDTPPADTGGKTFFQLVQFIPWYIYVLIPAALAGGIAAFYAYRKMKYGWYDMEQAFLVYKDGRLIAHRSKKAKEALGKEIVSGMLTALQSFIKESLQDEEQGELDEMKYGKLKIAIERAENIYLAVFLSGYITNELKAELRAILGRVNEEFGESLRSWDGVTTSLEKTGELLDGLIGTQSPIEKYTPISGEQETAETAADTSYTAETADTSDSAKNAVENADDKGAPEQKTGTGTKETGEEKETGEK